MKASLTQTFLASLAWTACFACIRSPNGKTFDYMPIIGTGDGAAETPFGSKLRA